MLDVVIPTTDGRELLPRRRAAPDQDIARSLERLGRTLPDQPAPMTNPASGPCRPDVWHGSGRWINDLRFQPRQLRKSG
ncbi:MAG: hypothetical protein IPL39_00865 [Opitutaceae bacterium]|nr:hypothetical protein [Opitutaceae bacterium]